MADQLSPGHIIQTGLAFWSAKTLLSAIELHLFTVLAEGPMDAEGLRQRLELHPRSFRDFFDSLVSLGFLERRGEQYSNTPESDFFLDRGKESYIGGILEMANARSYKFWGALTEGLRSGAPQNEAKAGEDFFGILYSDPKRLRGFLQAMTGISRAAGEAIAKKFPWERYQSFVDVGAAQGAVPVAIASVHPHLRGTNFDLPQVGPIFEEYVAARGLAERLRFLPGNFMKDELPKADVLIMGHILHDWNLEEKKMLLGKALRALPEGGALIVHESIIDDERRKNSFGLLMSLNMLLETSGGFDFTGADCMDWMKEVGFAKTYVEALVGPDSMVVGFK